MVLTDLCRVFAVFDQILEPSFKYGLHLLEALSDKSFQSLTKVYSQHVRTLPLRTGRLEAHLVKEYSILIHI